MRTRSRYLVYFLLVLVITEIGGMLNHLVWLEEMVLARWPVILLLDNPFLLAGAPFLWLYIRDCVAEGYRFKHVDHLHFLPAVLFAVVLVFRLSQFQVSEWGTAVSQRELLYRNEAVWLHFIYQLQFCLYAGYGIFITAKEGLFQYRSGLPKLLIGLILVKSIDLVEYSIYLISGQVSLINWILYIVYQIALLSWLALLFFDAIKDIRRFLSRGVPLKYDNTGLSEDMVIKVRMELLDLMVNEKPYLDPLVTLEKLAKKLMIQPYQLSQVINSSFNQNFFEFINGYRIEESKRMLTSEHASIEEVMHQSGFNSKSVFNTFFKKTTGLTPSAYRNQGT